MIIFPTKQKLNQPLLIRFYQRWVRNFLKRVGNSERLCQGFGLKRENF